MLRGLSRRTLSLSHQYAQHRLCVRSIANIKLAKEPMLVKTGRLLSLNSTYCHTQIRNLSQETSESQISERIEKMVKNNKVVVFMKGVPDQPMCGFSNAVVQVLRMHGVENYDSHNVLEDDELRQGIKEFSDWPTIPQVYFDGEFVGGCDIMLKMHQDGELVEELEKLGIKSALVKD